jgi:hypothetical protein
MGCRVPRPAPICASCRASCGKGLTALDMPACRKEAGPRIVPRQDIDPDQEKPTSACREQAFEVTISPPSRMTARERSDRYPEMKRLVAYAITDRRGRSLFSSRRLVHRYSRLQDETAWTVRGLVTDGNRRRPVGTGTDRARWLSRIRASSWD